jgi:hypothetical protein
MISSKSVAEVIPPERLGELGVVELELVLSIDADHRRQLLDAHAGLADHPVATT